MLGWIISAVVLGVCGVAYFQHRARRGTYQSLLSRMPDREPPNARVPLGMEEIDMVAVKRVSRRNESSERSMSGFSSGSGILPGRAAADSVEQMADDETYAKRYYSAFIKDKPKD